MNSIDGGAPAPLRVLVTGASIAGPALAFWLDRAGHEVTVVEQAEALREGGQNVDVRGAAREVVARMGLLEAARGRSTGEVGTRFVDEAGRTVSEFPATPGAGDGPTAELEILRGALSRLLVDACGERVTWRFGDSVASSTQDAGGVDVRFDSGASGRFDVVVAAEGVGSPTRDRLGLDAGVTPLDMYCAYGRIPRTAADDDWWRVLVLPGARQVHLRPDDVGTVRAMLTFREPSGRHRDLDRDAWVALLRDRFERVGRQTPRILDGLAADPDLYVEDLRQIRAATWHRGRVGLLGDAAWCVTPVGGGGTGLALIGAYVLAAELTRTPGHPDAAFAAYERFMRPVVAGVQDLPPGVPGIANPSSRAGVSALRLATKLAALPLAQRAVRAVTGGPGRGLVLPDMPVGPPR